MKPVSGRVGGQQLSEDATDLRMPYVTSLFILTYSRAKTGSSIWSFLFYGL